MVDWIGAALLTLIGCVLAASGGAVGEEKRDERYRWSGILMGIVCVAGALALAHVAGR